MKTFLLFSLLFFSSPLAARIGESYDECVARYGAPIQESEDDGVYVFEKAGYRVMVYFDDDWIADLILFNKGDEPPFAELSEREMEILLSVNVGSDLTESSEGASISWTNEATGAVGHYNPFQRGLIVASKAGMARLQGNTAAEERRALNGF